MKLNHGLCDIAINWSGGLHHAKKAEASGMLPGVVTSCAPAVHPGVSLRQTPMICWAGFASCTAEGCSSPCQVAACIKH